MEQFDWEFYLNFNKDVKDTLGYYKFAAVLHYETHGKDENRIYSEQMLYKSYPYLKYFDCEFYKKHNVDLQNLDKWALLKHYIYQGISEKRQVYFIGSIYSYFKPLLQVSISDFKPLISVIMPVYNRHELLAYSINSILNQTYSNIELIIIDDCSNKETKNVLEKYKGINNVIIMHNVENYGCYTSINLALNMCSGDYITCHGSDDVSLKYRIERLVKELNDENILMTGNYILRSHLKDFDVNELDDKIRDKIISFNCLNINHNNECCKPLVSLGTLLYKKCVFETIDWFENIRKGGDMVFLEKYLLHYENIKFTMNDCSHRYLTYNNKGKTYKIIDEILYISAEMNDDNITCQPIKFDINKYRNKNFKE